MYTYIYIYIYIHIHKHIYIYIWREKHTNTGNTDLGGDRVRVQGFRFNKFSTKGGQRHNLRPIHQVRVGNIEDQTELIIC